MVAWEQADEENGHGNAGGAGLGDGWSIRGGDATGKASDPERVRGVDRLSPQACDAVIAGGRQQGEEWISA